MGTGEVMGVRGAAEKYFSGKVDEEIQLGQ
jgi:hypothetical protein